MAPLDGELLDIDLSTFKVFNTAPSYELRRHLEGHGAETPVHAGDLPVFVV